MIVLKGKNLSTLMKLAIALAAFFLISIHFTVSASAAANHYTYWVFVGTSSDGKSVNLQTIGAILNWGGTSYIVCDNITEGRIYVFSYDGDTYYQMEECNNPADVKDDLNWFTPSGNLECTPALVAQGALSEEYSVLYINPDGKDKITIDKWETGSITIDECEECGNVYQVTYGNLDIKDGFYPMLIEDEKGKIIGYVPFADAAILFEKPTEDKGNSSSDDEKPTEDKGSSSSDDKKPTEDNSRMTALMIAAIVILALVGIRYFKKQKSDKSSSASKSVSVPSSIPSPPPAPSPVPAPPPISAPPPVPSPLPIPPPAPAPIFQQVNHQSEEWFIQMDGGAMNGFIYPIHTGILIGRNPECNVRYPADTKGVSRKHCKIFVNNNKLFVMDLGSTSGTFLQGIGQLTPNVPQSIHSGDIIYLGEKKNGIVIRHNQ